ncbi:MAG: biopolymer transporter ExbD [Planctomycetota bacterium]|nr:biopolymer transporter ExbD [Planctomycetota bacterium]
MARKKLETEVSLPQLNMTPMIDVIFQLLIFFMCTIKFRTMEGKLQSYLPKDKGMRNVAYQPLAQEIRAIIKYDETTGEVKFWLAENRMANIDALMEGIAAKHAEYKKTIDRPVPVIVDAEKNVPFMEVVRVLDLCTGRGIEGVEFALPPIPAKKQP